MYYFQATGFLRKDILPDIILLTRPHFFILPSQILPNSALLWRGHKSTKILPTLVKMSSCYHCFSLPMKTAGYHQGRVFSTTSLALKIRQKERDTKINALRTVSSLLSKLLGFTCKVILSKAQRFKRCDRVYVIPYQVPIA